jgi:hypothetical protein
MVKSRLELQTLVLTESAIHIINGRESQECCGGKGLMFGRDVSHEPHSFDTLRANQDTFQDLKAWVIGIGTQLAMSKTKQSVERMTSSWII